jgi:hypothetical protein
MKKLIINLSDNDYNSVRKNIKEWYGLNPTVPQLKKMLKGETAILADIATQPYLRSGLDTILREDVIDVFAHKLVGTSWPSNCTSKKHKKIFFNKLIQKAKESHIEVGIDEDYLD